MWLDLSEYWPNINLGIVLKVQGSKLLVGDFSNMRFVEKFMEL